MSEAKPVILVVEDDLDVADMLKAYFLVQNYEVLVANWGEDALSICEKALPDLIILDIRLPDIDGFEVARRLRTNRRTKEIPIIFLTEKRARADRLKGLELGADDYITKPFDVQELRLRVRNALRRYSQGAVINPVTGLGEGPLVDEQLNRCIGSDQWALLLISLENLDHFREAYGFVASDDVLRAVSLMVHNAARESGGTSDFIGHFSPTGFVLITAPLRMNDLRERIRSRLDQSLDYFYPLKDRGKETAEANKLSIRVSTLSPEEGPFNDLEQLKAQVRRLRTSRKGS